MRRFLINISWFSIIIVGVFTVFIAIRIYATTHIDFKESVDVHYLFTGASHPYHGIDDSLMETAVNRSAPSERYMFTYLKLKNILRDNPQIDTVFLQCAPTDLWNNTDDKYFAENEMSRFLPMYFPLFTSSEWNVYKNHLGTVIPLILQKSFDLKQLSPNALYESMGNKATKEENSIRMDRIKIYPDYPSLMTGEKGHAVNYTYLRRIIELCNEKGVKLYGVYFPVYHPEYYYDQQEYYTALSDLFPDLELLDYHNLVFPDSMRRDPHHLNEMGAKVFSKMLQDRFHIK